MAGLTTHVLDLTRGSPAAGVAIELFEIGADGARRLLARVSTNSDGRTDKPLIESGRFYPPDAKTPEARLRYYASRFPLVEVDSTYYGLPTVENSERWLERTPPGFTFDVKAYSLFTEHPTPVARLPKTLKEVLPAGIAAG